MYNQGIIYCTFLRDYAQYPNNVYQDEFQTMTKMFVHHEWEIGELTVQIIQVERNVGINDTEVIWYTQISGGEANYYEEYQTELEAFRDAMMQLEELSSEE